MRREEEEFPAGLTNMHKRMVAFAVLQWPHIRQEEATDGDNFDALVLELCSVKTNTTHLKFPSTNFIPRESILKPRLVTF